MTRKSKEKIDHLTSVLRKAGKHRLADCIDKNREKSVLEYSRELNSYSPLRPLEPEMKAAFQRELERIGASEIEKILGSLERRRILETAPHIAVTNTPRMLAINWLAALGVPDGEYCVTGVYSEIPFSNNSRPGRINRKTESVNLFPSSMQDDIVFRSRIPEKLVEAVKTLPPALEKLLPEAKEGESYTRWAVRSCQNIERKILHKENLIYLDINEVIENYWEEIESKKSHPMHEIKKLRESNLFLSFAPLLLNHFKCFGSFRQVEYLPEYQAKLAALPYLAKYQIEKVPTANLTTGELRPSRYPADIIIEESSFAPDPSTKFGELILNMKPDLLL